LQGERGGFEETTPLPLHPLSPKPFGTANRGRRLLNTTVCLYLFKRFAFEVGVVFIDQIVDPKAKLTSVSGQGLGGA